MKCTSRSLVPLWAEDRSAAESAKIVGTLMVTPNFKAANSDPHGEWQMATRYRCQTQDIFLKVGHSNEFRMEYASHRRIIQIPFRARVTTQLPLVGSNNEMHSRIHAHQLHVLGNEVKTVNAWTCEIRKSINSTMISPTNSGSPDLHKPDTRKMLFSWWRK
jgi:hypothetical protein